MGKIFTKMFGDKKEKPKESKWNDKDKAKLQLKRSRDRVRDFIKRVSYCICASAASPPDRWKRSKQAWMNESSNF